MSVKQINRLSPATVTVTTTAETVVLTSAPYVYDQPISQLSGGGAGQGVSISGEIYLSAVSASATTATIRVRQGGLTGPIVGVAVVTPVTASSVATLSYEQEDFSRFPAQSGGGTYVVTIAIAGAAANSTVTEATMEIQGA